MSEPWIGDIMVILTTWAAEPHDTVCPKDGSPCRHSRANIAIKQIQEAVAEIKRQNGAHIS